MTRKEQPTSQWFQTGSRQSGFTSSSSSTISKKRKMGSQVKFYAVKAGHNPGIYLNWPDCERNISGFKGASFKSFLTREEAESFVAGRDISKMLPQASGGVDKFYGVANGRVPGVYTDWGIAQEQITGWKNPKYKRFATKAEAEEFVQSGSGGINTKIPPTISMQQVVANPTTNNALFDNSFVGGRASKRIRHEGFGREDDGLLVVTDEQETQFNGGNAFMTPKVKSKAHAGVLRIHTDGSSLGNGQYGARAGLGVFFGPEDPRNLSERLPGLPQTNQRAEMAAILRALELSPTNREVLIITDSQYSIKCVTEWFRNWERNNWQTSAGLPVLNKDLIQAVLAKIRQREAAGTATKFSWIKGHSNDPGNEAADHLAVLGAQKSLVD